MKLFIISFQDTDVSDGLRKLLALGQGFDEIRTYGTTGTTFMESVNTVAEEFDLPVSPITETLAHIHHFVAQDDSVAFVWDDTEQTHSVYLSLEDFGLTTWDISEGLAAVETMPEEDDLEEELVSAFMNLMDTMTDYITENVLAMVEHMMEHMSEDDDE